MRRVNLENGRAVSVSTDNGEAASAEREIIVCGGSIDTPRLLLLSGIGPADDLRELDIEVQHDLPGVGENLIDHPESIIIWELNRPLPPQGVMEADCALFVNRLDRDPRPDLMYHTYQLPFTFNTERLGYPVPEHCICMTPNIPRSRSVGRMWLLSKDPAVKPALDFRYFTDEEGYDEQTIVDGLKIAREVANTEPFKGWLKREVAPGPKITSRRRPVRVRPRGPPHGLPPVGHVPDGRGRRRDGRGRSEASRARASRGCRSPTARSSRRCRPSTRWSARS